jgi:hypothetical protein
MCPTSADGPRRGVALWAVATIFLFTCTATLGFADWTADQVVLRCVYGAEVVRQDQLRIVSHKPVLRVSNEDVLEEWGFRHFLITGAIWLPLALGVLFVLIWVAPKEYRETAWSFSREMAEPSSRDRSPPGLFYLLLIPTVPIVICLSPSAVASGFAALVALAMAWITAVVARITGGRAAPPCDSAPDHR